MLDPWPSCLPIQRLPDPDEEFVALYWSARLTADDDRVRNRNQPRHILDHDRSRRRRRPDDVSCRWRFPHLLEPNSFTPASPGYGRALTPTAMPFSLAARPDPVVLRRLSIRTYKQLDSNREITLAIPANDAGSFRRHRADYGSSTLTSPERCAFRLRLGAVGRRPKAEGPRCHLRRTVFRDRPSA